MYHTYFTKLKSGYKYLCIPSCINPRIIIPLSNRKSFIAGLGIHNTSRLRNRLFKEILADLYFILRFYKKLILYRKKELEKLLEFLSQRVIGTKDVAFYVGTQGNSNQKLTLLLLDITGKNLGVIKIPLTTTGKKYAINELNILQKMSKEKFRLLMHPKRVELIKWNSTTIIFQEHLFSDSTQVSCNMTIDIVNASIELGTSTIDYSSSFEYFEKYLVAIRELDFREEILKKVRNTIKILQQANIPLIRIHGDYVPYNLRFKNKKIILIDWEFARKGLPLHDLFHFIFQGSYQIKKTNVNKVVYNMFKTPQNELLNYYMNELKIDISLIKELFIMYLVESAILKLHLCTDKRTYSNHFIEAIEKVC